MWNLQSKVTMNHLFEFISLVILFTCIRLCLSHSEPWLEHHEVKSSVWYSNFSSNTLKEEQGLRHFYLKGVSQTHSYLSTPLGLFLAYFPLYYETALHGLHGAAWRPWSWHVCFMEPKHICFIFWGCFWTQMNVPTLTFQRNFLGRYNIVFQSQDSCPHTILPKYAHKSRSL